MAAQDYKQAVDWLYHWRRNRGDNFASLLYELMCKADRHNSVRLTLAFPHEAQALSDWRAARSENEFFRSHGFTNV